MKYTITLTENQAYLVLQALYNEQFNDPAEWNEYSYGRCYVDVKKKLNKEGY